MIKLNMEESIYNLLNKILKSFLLTFIPLFIVVMGILTYINYISITNKIDVEFKSTETISKIQLLNTLENFYNISKQISSRTAAKENFKQYIKGEKGLQEATTRISKILQDALEVSNSIKGIQRVTKEGKLLVSIGHPFTIKKWENINTKKVTFIQIDHNYIISKSPILDNDTLLGYDCVLFSLDGIKQLLSSINKNNYKYEVILAYKASDAKLTSIGRKTEKTLYDKTPLFYQHLDHNKFELGNKIYSIEKLIDSKLFLIIKAKKDILYEARDTLFKYILIFSIFIFFILFIVFRKLIHPLYHRLIDLFKKNEKLNTTLNSKNQQLKTLFDMASDGIHILDTNGNILMCSQSFADTLGYSLKEAQNLNIKDWDVGKVSPDQLVDTMHKFMKAPKVFETKHKRKDSSIVDVQINAKGIELEGKRYLYASQRDITKQKEKEKLILEQKEEFETIFKSSRDGIAIVDQDTRFINCNDAFLELTGFTKEEILTKTCKDLTVEEDKEKNDKAVEFAIQKHHIENLEKKCISKEGNIFTVNMSITLLPDNQRLLLSIKDMTPLKLLEEQSRLASMGEMIGNIAHQWRQPLSIITTSASGMKFNINFQGTIDKDELIKTSDLIVTQANYLSQTIDNFKDFIKGDLDYSDISIKESLQSAINLTRSAIDNNYITLVTDIEDDISINGNSNELMQAFMNIINNAKDAIIEKKLQDEDKVMLISTKKLDDNSLKVTFQDSGGGIEKKIIDRIFEPYFTTKYQSLGTGLGLSMVDKIIRERHKGDIFVRNAPLKYHDTSYIGACFDLIFKNDQQ